MLRFASSHAGPRVHNYRLSVIQLRECAKVGKRHQTTGRPVPLPKDPQENGEERYRRHDGRPKLERPGFLQSLRVQSNPISEATYRMNPAPRPTNTGMANLLRQQPGVTAGPASRPTYQQRPKSATQSQLPTQQTATSTPIGKSDSLVDFFKRRLEEHGSGTASTKIRAIEYPPTSSIRRPLGLVAARDQALAEKNNAPRSPVSVSEALKNTVVSGEEARTDTFRNTQSIIGKFAEELRKRNLAQKAAQTQAHQKAAAEPQPEIPSWRKSFKNYTDTRSKHLSNSFTPPSQAQATPPQQQANVEPHVQLQSPQPKLISAQQRLQEMLAKSEEEERQRKKTPREQKVFEIVVPAGELTIRELSELFKVKASRITEVLREMGETPEITADYSIGKCRLSYCRSMLHSHGLS